MHLQISTLYTARRDANNKYSSYCTEDSWTLTAHSVQRLATGWTVLGSKPFLWVGAVQDYSRPSRPALGTLQPPTPWVPGVSRRVKQPRRGVDNQTAPSAEVRGRVELYLYYPSGIHCIFQGNNNNNNHYYYYYYY